MSEKRIPFRDRIPYEASISPEDLHGPTSGMVVPPITAHWRTKHR
jgi:hypothetical protein